ncbi:hypothetical protein N0V88_000232 [Collariella sp. IMI 366227]|nr:hypothetical protein N0V88_000232 [Collariella sp. IMI 366227]
MAPSPSKLSAPRHTRTWDAAIPSILRPLVRAYLLGYATAVGPRLLTLLLQHLARARRNKQTTTARDTHRGEPFLDSLQRLLRGGLDWQRFPTFCAVLVGGTTLFELPLRVVFNHIAKNTSDIARRRLSRWCASFAAAWLSIRLLQSKQTPSFTDTVVPPDGAGLPQTVRYAGRTLDLTLFAVTRAADVIVGELWARHKARRLASNHWTPLEATISHLTDPAIFALSSALVMWTWFYNPSRLPRNYNKWLGSAAAVDSRLIAALQRCRDGAILYGCDTGQGALLSSMCADYGLPPHWGDPAVSVPFPCQLVHMGVGKSCELHAASRFARSFRWALASYLPLTLLPAILRAKGSLPTLLALRRALFSAARSSAFLASFITLFYYGVCLARTRLGPHLLGTSTAARQRIDGGVCVGMGCMLCGWSILLEEAGRRKDVALFVAPRALATLFPRRLRASHWV